MMKQSTSFAQVATNLLNVLQGCSKTIRLLLVMLLTLTVTTNAWGALSSPYECVFKTTSKLTNNQVTTGDVTWTLSTTIGAGTPATDFGNTNGQSAIKLGSGKKNYYSKMTLTTSAFSTYNVSKVVLYISSNNGGSKTITVKQGNTQIGTGSQNFTSTDWVTNCTRNTTKGSGGDLSIEISSDATATFIHSITVTYEETSCSVKPTVGATLQSLSTTENSITATIPISSIGGCNITENGLVYSTTNSTPTVGGSGCTKVTTTACGSTAANKTVTITGLTCGQSYYIRGYATNEAGTSYTNVTTKSTSDCPKYTVTLKDDNSTLTQITAGGSVTLPPREGCEGYTFAGWTKSWKEEQEVWTTTAPTIIPAGSYTPTANENLYPVYTKTEGGGSEPTAYSAGDVGSFIIASNVSDKWYAIPENPTLSSGKITGVEITVSQTAGGVKYVSTANAEGYTWTIADATNGQTISDGTKYIYHSNGGASETNLTYGTSTSYTWKIEKENNGLTFKGMNGSTINSRGLLFKGSVFGGYALSNEDASGYYRIQVLPIGGGSTTYYISVPDCTTQPSVTLNPNGGTFAPTPNGWTPDGGKLTKEVDGSVTLPTPTHDGCYDFAGWYDAQTGGNEIDADAYTPTEDIELFAHWTESTTSFIAMIDDENIPTVEGFAIEIGLNEDGTGKVTDGVETTCGNNVYLFRTLVQGYKEVQWTVTIDETQETIAVQNDGDVPYFVMPKANVFVSAELIECDEMDAPDVTATSTHNSITLSWNPIIGAKEYNVFIFYDYGNSHLQDDANLVENETSYTFTNLDAEHTYTYIVQAQTEIGTCFTETMGEIATASATCTVTYDANGGEGTIIDNTEYTNGATVTVLGNYGKFTKDGYAFTGWNTQADGSGDSYKHNDQFDITANTILYAQWCEAHWALVTSTSEIENDTRIVIAAKDEAVALSTEQKSNNRGQAEITKKYNTITFGADVQILNLLDATENKYWLSDVDEPTIGYLYAAGSNSNYYLKTGVDQSGNGNDKWEFAFNNDIAYVHASGTNTNNQLKYNSSSDLFSCYGTTNSQKDVVIYKEVCVQDQYNVASTLTNATAVNTNPTTVDADATSLTLNYSANTGYLLPETITVKMGGALLVATTDYTWDKATGALTVNVTGFYGDIDVKIVAEADPCYQFEMSEVTATSTTPNSVTLTWTEVTGATGYNVRLGDGAFIAATGLTHTFEGLTPKTTYNWEVQAVKDGLCEASKTGTTTTQKESFTVSWVVNGNTTATESVVDGNSITQYPSDPSAPSGCHEKVFVGWTDNPINTPTDEAPATLYKQQSDVPAITVNTTLHAVWATAEGGSGNGEEEKKVTLDFTNNSSWEFPTSKTTTSSIYTDANGNSITLGGVTSNGWAWYENGKYFLYGQSGCYIQFPAFDFTVTKFVTKGRTGASGSVTQNIFVGDEAVSKQTTGTTGENTYEIASEYQEAGNVYLLKVTSSHNAQVTQIDIYGITSSITTAYTTLCDECTLSESLVLAANASTADLDINGKATITFSTTGGNGGEITYAANPETGVTWENGTATFKKAGEYSITASQGKNGEYCPTTSNTVNVTITAIPHLYFVTDPAPTTIEFDPVECGGNTRVEDKKSVSVQAYNLAAAVTAQVTGPYKIARTSGATLNEYSTTLTLDKNEYDGHINGYYDDIYILSFPPAGSSEPTEGTLTFTTTNGNTLTVYLSTPTITCTPRTLTFNDRGIKTTQQYYAGTEVPEPATPTGVCGEYEFDGWALAKIESGSTTYAKVEFPYIMPANNQTVLYAVYRYTEGPTNQYELVTEIESGKDYVIAAYDKPNGDFALTNTESNTSGKFTSVKVECDVNDIITTDNADIIWTVTGNDEDGYKFYNSAVKKYIEMYRSNGKSLLRLVDNCTNTFDVNIEMDENDDIYVDITSPEVDATYNVFSFYEQLFNVYKSCDYNIYFYEQTATPFYTTTPDCHPSVTLTSDGEVYVTATNGRGIMAATPLMLTTTDLAPNTEIAISSNSSDIYFSTERNTNFAMAQASQPKTSLTLTTNEGGELETPLYIHYKPSADGDGTPAEVVVTADVSTHNPPFTAQKTIHVRNLPAKFVIATKAGATWYTLPANMNAATNPAAVVIEVDETTMTATAPNTTPYTLWPVATINGGTDRYKKYGERLRFAAVNNGNKGLWANNADKGTTINNNGAIVARGDNPGAAYEWKVTTMVVDGLWQYTLQTDQANNQKNLCYRMNQENPAWGTYASNEAQYQLYFLPIKAETTPFDYQVVEWYPNKVLIHTTTAFSSLTAKIAGEQVANVLYTAKDANQYEITGLPLMENPAKALTLEFVVADATHTGIHTIPVMLSGGDHSISTLAIDKGIYNYTDLVVRDDATLTVDGAANTDNTFYDITIYPTAKISVPEGKQLSVHSLTFFGGIDDIYDGEKYTTNKYGVPQLSLKGTLGKTVKTIDYIMRVDLEQMYQMGVPYDVNLGEITYWDGTSIELGSQLYVSAYDGQARANRESKTWIWETDFAEKVLKPGIGYTISAEPQVEGDTYSILRMPMKNNIASGNTEAEKSVNVVAYDNQKDVTITDNHKGWNYLSNPYMAAISGAEADSKLVVGYLRETGTGPWEWVNDTYRYVTIPHNDGEDYYQQKFSDATLLPFKSFFLQIATNGELSFALASRQALPARLLQQENAPREVEFEILLANDTRSDNMGLLIGEDYTPAYEINADLEKMIGSMSVYTIYNGYNLAYNALSPINAQEQIPIGYVVPDVGEYTFKLDENADVENIEHIYLNDLDMNVITDLLEDEYTFYASEKKNEARFVINVIMRSEQEDDTPTRLEELDINTNHAIKFFYQDKLYILRNGIIYDAMGKQVKTINK